MAPESLERILDALGKRFIPADLDRTGLANDLECAAIEYRLGKRWRKRPADLQKKLERTARYAQKVIDELKDDTAARIALEALPEDVRGALLASGFDLSDLLGSLVLAPALHEHELDKISALKQLVDVGNSSAVQWLAGVTLPEIYQRHFRRKGKRSRDNGGPASGPYIRFVSAVLGEFSITKSDKPYSVETIDAAVGHGGIRRQNTTKNTI